MAEVTGLRNNALPYPIYGVPFGVTYPLLDADGDLVTGATTPDAERSLNGDTFADCTNESTEIATNSGVYYLLLTGAEMTADVVTVIAKSATAGMKTTVLTLYPRKLVSLRAGTSQTGAAGSITLDASASAIDDYYNGCICVAVIDTLTEARVITDYVGSTKVASVTPNWNVTPDSDDTFTIYLPEGRQIPQSDNVGWLGSNIAAVSVAGVPEVDLTHVAGATTSVSTIASSIATLLAAVGTLTDAAVDGDPTTTDTLMQYVKQLVNTLVGTAGIPTWPTGAAPGNAVSIAEGLRYIVGTLGTPTYGISFGHDNTTFASIIGALDDAAADGDPTTDDTLMAYLKQLINTLEGGPGIPTWPAAAAPGNAVSIAEALRYLYDQVGVAGAGLTAADDAVIAAIPSAATVADAVWDEDATAHQSAGTFGLAIGDPAASSETMYKAIVTDPAGTNIAADVIAVKAETAAILEDTGTTLQGEVDGIQADTEDIQARLPAALVGGRIDATVDGTGMETGAIDAIWAKAMSDLAAVPAANASALAAINFMYMLARNTLTQTATTGTLMQDDGSTPVGTTTVADDLTTFTRGEWT